ncbi:hypothetical protein LB505_008458 [Fusarium chuoi]|nr:hypothetical protein LB505_008458 [Fusarium chuoi]
MPSGARSRSGCAACKSQRNPKAISTYETESTAFDDEILCHSRSAGSYSSRCSLFCVAVSI